MVTVALLLVLAEGSSSLDPISGGAGWIGAGLLGLVLGWLLLVHLPTKDKQLKDFLEGKDKQFEILLDKNRSSVEKLSEDFKLDLKTVIDHCGAEMKEIGERFRDEMTSLRETLVKSFRGDK